MVRNGNSQHRYLVINLISANVIEHQTQRFLIYKTTCTNRHVDNLGNLKPLKPAQVSKTLASKDCFISILNFFLIIFLSFHSLLGTMFPSMHVIDISYQMKINSHYLDLEVYFLVSAYWIKRDRSHDESNELLSAIIVPLGFRQ